MAMIKYPKYLALALLTTGAVAVHGQEEKPDSPSSDPEALPPS